MLHGVYGDAAAVLSVAAACHAGSGGTAQRFRLYVVDVGAMVSFSVFVFCFLKQKSFTVAKADEYKRYEIVKIFFPATKALSWLGRALFKTGLNNQEKIKKKKKRTLESRISFQYIYNKRL